MAPHTFRDGPPQESKKDTISTSRGGILTLAAPYG